MAGQMEMQPIPMLALLRAKRLKEKRDLPTELWLGITSFAVTKDEPVPIWALPAHYGKLLAPFKNTNLEPHAKKTFWEKTTVRHTQSMIIFAQGSEIKNLHPTLRDKMQHLQVDTHISSLPRQLDDIAQTVRGCPAIQSLTIHLTVSSINPSIMQAGLGMICEAMHGLVGPEVKKTAVALCDFQGSKYWCAKRLKKAIAEETVHENSSWTAFGDIEVTVIQVGQKEVAGFMQTLMTAEV
ncbi:hypothetical protein M409DRAFT_22257 [Zasmidium cellare ATCC 36951]|uniref:Uncharacterized protein n=1 Tax=Zasmidium cellare ATCC 36951 TaxID=1080233 RepID=A0A6A6CNX9_ZASCE|nr:uncharacterized protein M409DRAFT_22257 [Zasmidium cellare ATCC 36951]KAF2167449.1 hypothetical protein M409DRAFT_22257 [Zasmidium cellare ATCC 36951]